MEGGTGVYYQAMPAVGPDGKNVMKLIPVQKVNGQFYQTYIDRDNVDLQLKAYAKPVHLPPASSSQIQPRLPSLHPTADGRYVLKTMPEVRVLSNSVRTQQDGANNLIIHNPKQVHVPPQLHSISQYTVQLPPQPNQKCMTAVQTLPVTVKSPVLPNGHFLQIPPNAKVRTMPATALPQSIKCRIMNSVSNTPNLGKTPTVVLVSPVNSVKLNTDQQVVSLTKPIQVQNTLSPNPPAIFQTPACVPKTSEVNTPIKWVVQEGTGASAPCLIPLSTPDVNSDSIKTVKNANLNEIAASKPTPPQTGEEKITPGKDNALVMCNGKVYFVAKKNSEIAKDVMISEGGKRGVVSTSPALPASSALASNSPKPDPKHNISEIIDLCDDDGEMSTCLGGAPGNLPTPSQTEVDESDEESNVIFVSYIPPKSCKKVANLDECEELTEVSVKSVAQNEGEKTTHTEKESEDRSNNQSDEMMNEQVKENEMVERNTSCFSETVNMEEDKRSSETRCQDDAAVTENVSLFEQPQNVCIQATEDIQKVFESPAPDQRLQPKSDSQLRKEFGITSDVQISLHRTKPAMMGDQQTEKLIINKITLDGLRKVIQESKLQLKIQQMIQAPHTETEEDKFLKAKRRKLEQKGSRETPSLSTINVSPGSESSALLMGSSLVSNTCQKEVRSANKDHMQSEAAENCPGDTCCLSPTLKQKAPQTATDLLPPSPARKVPPRSKKGKVCTACPCGTILGAAETISSQKKTNLCTVDNSNKGTKQSCTEKAPGENLQPQKHFVKKTAKKLSSESPINNIALLERSTSETSVDITSSASLFSSLPQLVLSSVQTECSNTDAETSHQDKSQAETTSNYPSMALSRKPPGPKLDKFPIQELYTSEALDAEEIKRLERIKRLKDLLKEKEAALEQMQRSMNV